MHTHIAVVEIIDVALTEVIFAVARALLISSSGAGVYIEIDIGQNDH